MRRAEGEEGFGPSIEMLCTVRNWHHDEATLSHEALFMWNEQQLPPEILLKPLPKFPSKLRNGSVVPFSFEKINYRVSLADIYKATVVVDACRILLSLPHRTTLEIDCLTRNGCDLLGASLQSRLPPLRWGQVRREMEQQQQQQSPQQHQQEPHLISPSSSNDEYDVDALTSACMRLTAARESLSDKLERRWGKAVHDFGLIMEGGASSTAADL